MSWCDAVSPSWAPLGRLTPADEWRNSPASPHVYEYGGAYRRQQDALPLDVSACAALATDRAYTDEKTAAGSTERLSMRWRL